MKFLSPKGAVKDAKELEYLVALHQTTHYKIEEFRDGSIDAEDVRVFLLSAYGISVTREQVREYIFEGLAGVDETMDILEIVAILLIPVLVKVSDSIIGNTRRNSVLSDDQQRLLPPQTIIADVLQDILSDTTDGAFSTSKPPQLTPQLLRQIFAQYDELELLKDDKLIEEMIAVCKEDKAVGAITLDVKSFARALTTDVQLYNPENENRYTEIIADVFPDGFGEQNERAGNGVKKIKTLMAHMDYTADTFVHSLHVSMVWLVIVFSFFFYLFGIEGFEFLKAPSDGFGYKVGYNILQWIVTMLRLVIFGGVFGFWLVLGNGLPQTSFSGPVLGLIGVAVLVFLPSFYKTNNEIFNSDLENSSHHSSWSGLGYMLVVFGLVLILLQLKNIFDYYMPNFQPTKMYKILDGIAGSNTKRAFRSKQAGIYKINQLVKNAYELHKPDERSKKRAAFKSYRSAKDDNVSDGDNDSKEHTSSKAIAIQNYANQVDELEEVGGLVWSVKEYFSGRLAGTEGVWLPSRLLAANAILFFATIICITVSSIVFRDIIDTFYPTELPNEVIYSNTCFLTFDYSKCYFPFEERGFYAGVGVCRDVALEGPECYDLFAPLDSTEGLDRLIGVGYTCLSLKGAFAKIEAEVSKAFLGASCSAVLGAAKDFVNQLAVHEQLDPAEVENFFDSCYGVNTMTEEDTEKFNEWFDDDQAFPDITYDIIDTCAAVEEILKVDAFSELAPGFEDAAFEAYRTCMGAYGSIVMDDDPCANQLFSPTQEIYVYEKDSDGDDFCVTFLKACYLDPYKPTRGTCVIGASIDDISLFQFEGPTCNSYPEINKTLNFYEENVLPTQLSVQSFFPAKWTLNLTAIISIITGSIVALITTAVYIPSSIHTVLKFRCGVIPSLKDPKFLKYRENLVNQTFLIGAMFWGLLVTTLLVTVFVAILVFLFVWPATRRFVINLIAQLLGIAVTIILRTALCVVFLRTAYAGFYRKMPALAPAFMFALEVWNLALTIPVVLDRVLNLLLSAGLYAGRIDKPVLVEGLVLNADELPRMFRQNLLSAEAHRHPYLVQLGGMYLMKLRHKDDFGNKAGSIWRLLFVSVLMPWLRKKRIQGDVDIDDESASKMMKDGAGAGEQASA